MHFRRDTITTALALAGALSAIALTATVASATALPKTLWVSPSPAVAGGGSSCAKPGYNEIQAAVNAATSGSTINVCAGTYTEQVAITKSLAVIGSGSPTIVMPATPADSTTACDTAFDAIAAPDQDGVVVCGAVNVTLQGIKVDAAFSGVNCYANEGYFGIVVAGGATLNFLSSAVTAAGAVPLNGCQGGIGLQVGNSQTTPVQVGHLNLLNSSVSGYQKNGIDVEGSGSSGSITGATVTGIGPTPEIAQNGIQVEEGATAQILSSTITGDECNYPGACGPNGLTQYGGSGVLLEATGPSSVIGSTISNNDEGIYYVANPEGKAPLLPTDTIAGDSLINDRYQGIQLNQGSALITGSQISGGNVGIQLLQYAGQTFGIQSYASADVIKGEAVAAVQVLSDQAPGDFPGTFTISLSKLSGNAASVLDNSSNLKVLQLADY